MPPLEEQLGLDVSPALQAVEEIDRALQAVVEAFSANLASALDVLSAPPETINVPVDADTAAMEASVAAAEAGLPAAEIPVDADTGAAESSISGFEAAVGATDVEVGILADLSALDAAEAELDRIAATSDVTIAVTADTSEAEGALHDVEAVGETLEVEIPVSADTAEAEQNVESLGGTAKEAGGGFGILDAAVVGMTDDLAAAGSQGGALGGALGAIGTGGIAAAGGVAVAAAGLVKLTETGSEVIAVGQQFEAVFGDAGAALEQIDVAGLNTDLDELALSLGVDDEALRTAATSAGALLQTFGNTKQESALLTEQLVAAAAGISSMNPAAGDLTTIMQQLTSAVATGRTRGLKKLGIEITPEEIDAFAASLGKTTEELTATEKQAFFVQQIMGQVGDVSDDVAQRQENAAVVMASFRERLSDLFEEMAVPVAAPVVETLEQLLPLMEDLSPVFRLAGQTIAGFVKSTAGVFSVWLDIVATVIDALESTAKAANDIPGVGRLVPDSWGSDLENVSNQLHGAADSARAASEGNTTYTASADAAAGSSADAAGAVTIFGMSLNPIPGALEAVTGATAAMQEEMKKANEAAAAFGQTAVDTLPGAASAIEAFGTGIADAFRGVADAGKEGGGSVEDAMNRLRVASDPGTFVANLEKMRVQIINWRANLQTIGQEAPRLLEQLIAVGPERGSALAQSIADGIRAGKPGVAQAAEASLGAIENQYTVTGTWVGSEGRSIIEGATGRAAGAGTTAWSENFNLFPGAQAGMTGAETGIEQGTPGVTGAATTSGATAETSWIDAFTPASGAATNTAATGPAITNNTPTGAARRGGGAAAGGFVSGYNPTPGVAGATGDVGVVFSESQLRGLIGQAEGGGTIVGWAFGQGLVAGIGSYTRDAERAAEAIVQAAIDAAHAKAQTGSPSRVTYGLGQDMGRGLALGLASTTGLVGAGARALTGAAIPRIGGARFAGGAQTGSGAVTVNTYVSGTVTPEGARRIGDEVGAGVVRQLIRRDVVQQVRAG